MGPRLHPSQSTHLCRGWPRVTSVCLPSLATESRAECVKLTQLLVNTTNRPPPGLPCQMKLFATRRRHVIIETCASPCASHAPSGPQTPPSSESHAEGQRGIYERIRNKTSKRSQYVGEGIVAGFEISGHHPQNFTHPHIQRHALLNT